MKGCFLLYLIAPIAGVFIHTKRLRHMGTKLLQRIREDTWSATACMPCMQSNNHVSYRQNRKPTIC